MTLKDAIAKSYTKEELVFLYELYLRSWIEKEWITLSRKSPFLGQGSGLSDEAAEPEQTTIDPKKAISVQKHYFISMLEQFYGDEQNFKRIYVSLDETIRTLFARVVYEYRVPFESVDTELLEVRAHGSKAVKKEFAFFDSHLNHSYWDDDVQGHFFLHESIIAKIKPWLPKPPNYHLQAVALVDGLMECDFERKSAVDLRGYRDFVATQIRYAKSGTILRSSYKKMAKSLQIDEFYAGDKRTELLRSELLATFLDSFKEDLSNALTPSQFLKEAMTQLRRDEDSGELSLSALFESHIKGRSTYYGSIEYKDAIFQTLAVIIEEMPVDEWVSFDNIIDFMFYRDLHFELYNSYGNCYITTYRTYGSDKTLFPKRVDINSQNYLEYVTRPLFKGLMSLLASLGLLRLKYVSPFSGDQHFKEGCLSYYDGLVAIQLTTLGSYAFGLADEYIEPDHEQSTTTISLSERRLIITLKGDDPIKRFIVEGIAKKQTEQLYQFDYETLYKGAKTSEEITEKLASLFAIAEGEVPQNWMVLQESITKRLNPLQQRTTFTVLELNHDIDLLKILATDTILKKLIIKAENYMIVVKKSDITAVKQRLRKYGYFFGSK